jgi:FixJ family two-component response regulator
VILVASDPPVPVVVEAMKAGAFDLLERPVDPVRFVERVWEAISVRRSHLAEAAEVQRVESLLENLTRRERQLVELILAGMSTKEVAYELGIREVTVDFHRRNVYKKMGVENSVRLSRMVENYRHRKERLAG